VAGFALVGTPGTVGFISKWYLVVAALDQGMWLLVAAILASSLIALVYVGRVLETMWLRQPSPAMAEARDPPPSMLLPLLVLAGSLVYFGLDTDWTVSIAERTADMLLGRLR
jgi:multicomponent Na+:H+ antiporter subunit D